MWVLLGSGVLYLIGISIVLVLRPALMFDEQGVWKEFRIGGDKQKYTWMPFWLFAIVWAVTSFVIVSLMARVMRGSNSGPHFTPNVNMGANTHMNSHMNTMEAPNVAYSNIPPAPTSQPPETVKVPKRRGASMPLPPGYYMLDKEAFNGTGTPHYVYIGEAPTTVADYE
jgi:hypothetical protein